jgi:hypothetical protein
MIGRCNKDGGSDGLTVRRQNKHVENGLVNYRFGDILYTRGLPVVG